MASSIDNHTAYLGNNRFRFLNIEHEFSEKIDWDIPDYGKLWTYNANYFEFLNQANSKYYEYDFKSLISDYSNGVPSLKSGNEPFPTSLRIINWIKYIIKSEIRDLDIIKSLYCQCYVLKDNKEFHLMGNHLLENGFALTIAGIFFQDMVLYNDGKRILEDELNEQILNDGAHFELSPMYHCLMLYRLLDTINILKSNLSIINKSLVNQDAFLSFLKLKGEKMCSWIKAIMYVDGTYPHFNDSTEGIAPTANQLIEYAKNLEIVGKEIQFADSGYRKLKNQSFDVIIKAGKIGSDYISGHAHADSMTYELRISNIPVLIDTGISTYENNNRRQLERSTIAHNTLSVDNRNSSQVWGGFRVGKKAKSKIILTTPKLLKIEHKGYCKITHDRTFDLDSNRFFIFDQIKGNDSIEGVSNLIFHPEILIEEIDNFIYRVNKTSLLIIENANKIQIVNYNIGLGFNKITVSQKMEISFVKWLKTSIIEIEN